MARKITTTVVCDLPHDGEVVSKETVSFSFEGTAYEIDVCTAHAKELHDKFSAYTDHAGRAGAAGRRRRARTGPGAERGDQGMGEAARKPGERARPYSRDDHPGVRGLALTRLRARVGGQMRAGPFRRAAVRGPARRDRQRRSQPDAQSAGQRRAHPAARRWLICALYAAR